MRNLVLVLLMILATPALRAQGHGMPANCHGMLTATLASGRARGDLQGCGSLLADDLANAVRRASVQDDTARLARILTYSYSIRDVGVFEAALDLARNRNARQAARALGLAVAVAQYDPRLSFQGGRSAGTIFLEAPTPECSEIVFLSEPGGTWYDGGLPRGAEDRLRNAVEVLQGNSEPSPVVRGLARCAALLLPDAPQPVLTAGSVSVGSTCDEFIVTNNTGLRLELSYVIETAEPERGTIVLLPHGREGILHEGKGALRLVQGGQAVAYHQLDPRRCPTP